MVQPVTFTTEEQVLKEYQHHYKKDMEVQLARLGSVVSYERNEELDVFIRTDLQKIADRSSMAFGKEFNNMTAEEKQIFLARMQDKEEKKRLREMLSFDDEEGAEEKLNGLKKELQQIERQKKSKQRNKSYSIIQELVQVEVKKQQEIDEEERQKDMIKRIKKEQIKNRQKQTS